MSYVSYPNSPATKKDTGERGLSCCAELKQTVRLPKCASRLSEHPAGRTTLARAIAVRLNLPHLVWLDYERPVIMARMVRRSLFRTILRTDLWAGIGNREQWCHLLRPSHPIRWAWNTWHRASPRNCGAPQEGRVCPSSGPAPSARREPWRRSSSEPLLPVLCSHSLRILKFRAAEEMGSFSPPLPKARTLRSGIAYRSRNWRKDLLREARLAPENKRYHTQDSGRTAPKDAKHR
jgi:hypothetical protein